MKRTEVIRHLEQNGCVLLREGGKYSVKTGVGVGFPSKKFLSLSEPVLGMARAEAAIETILSVDSLPTLAPLVDAVTKSG